MIKLYSKINCGLAPVLSPALTGEQWNIHVLTLGPYIHRIGPNHRIGQDRTGSSLKLA